MIYLAFDIGGSSIKIATIKKNGKIIEHWKIKTPKTYEEFMRILKEKIKIIKPNVVCFSSPGSVDSTTYEVKGISAVPYIHEHNFCKEIKEEFGVDVSIENDANCSALGEVYFGSKYKNALFMTIGTGIGGAVICNGKLVKGINNEAGEFGYMLLDKSRPDWNFSKLTTIPNVVKRLKENEGISCTNYEALNNYFEGVEPYYTYVKDALDYLGMGIYNLRYIYDPEVLIIGGGISEDKRYIQEIRKRCPFITIKTCTKFNSNNLLGALAKYLQDKGDENIEI